MNCSYQACQRPAVARLQGLCEEHYTSYYIAPKRERLLTLRLEWSALETQLAEAIRLLETPTSPADRTSPVIHCCICGHTSPIYLELCDHIADQGLGHRIANSDDRIRLVSDSKQRERGRRESRQDISKNVICD